MVLTAALEAMKKLAFIALLAPLCACAQEASEPVEVARDTIEEVAQSSDQSALSVAQDALKPPPPRRSVEGVFGFTARSLIQFKALPDSPHRLTSTYGFPERARWYLEPARAATGQRSVRYRSGPQVWELFPGGSEAARYQEEQELHAFLQLELRRAAMMWPSGIEWVLETADGTDGSVTRATHQLKTGGTLKATLKETDTLPSSFSSEIDGALFEEYRAVRWSEGARRERPIAWTLYHRGAEVWVETIERFHTDIRYVDGHFLPPHLRELPGEGESNAVLLGEVPARARKRQTLSATSWEDAISEAERHISSMTKLNLPGVIDQDPVFELNENGLPSALFLRLILTGHDLPEGWEEAPGESALSLMLPEGKRPSAAALSRLQDACPADAKTGTPRLRVRMVDGAPESSQLLLPLIPSVSGD